MRDRAYMLDEVFRRADGIRRRRTRRQAGLFGTAACALLAALFVMVGNLAGGATVRPTALGAFLLGPEAGGYVIVALISFALGIAITLATQKFRGTDRSRADAEGRERQK